MEIEIAIAVLILVALVFLATIDMAFSQLSDLSLRRLTSDTVEDERVNTPFMREILGDRPRFRFALSATIQILLIVFSVLVTLIVYNFYQKQDWLLTISLIIAFGAFGNFSPVYSALYHLEQPRRQTAFSAAVRASDLSNNVFCRRSV